MSLVKIGNLKVSASGVNERTFDPVYGPRTQITFEGDEASCTAMGLAIARFAKSRIRQLNGPVYNLIALFGDGGPFDPSLGAANDVYDLVTEFAQQDIRNNPILQGLAKVNLAPTAENIAAVAGAAQQALQSTPQYPSIALYYANVVDWSTGSLGPPLVPPTTSTRTIEAWENYVFQMVALGESTFEVKRAVLRRRRSIAADYASPIVIDAVDTIYKPASLGTVFGPLGGLLAQLPGDPTTRAANPINAIPNHIWGWKLKTQSSEYIPAVGKVEEVMEWVFASWNQYLYLIL